MLKTGWLVIAQAGKTVDGRKITEKQIEQMAENYDPKKYGARIWIEHMRSMIPDGCFPALGDVCELKAEKVDGSLKLFAKLSPTARLLEMNKERQKIYTSIEMDTNFADTKKAYLVGLAVTDSPASLATSMLAFSQQNRKDIAPELAKQITNNVFSIGLENEIKLENESQEQDSTESLFSKIKSLFATSEAKTEQKIESKNKKLFADIEKSILLLAQEQQEHQEALADRMQKIEKKLPTFAKLENIQGFDESISSLLLFKSKVEDEEMKSDREKADGMQPNKPIKF